MVINWFSGKYGFLSNFSFSPILLGDGLVGRSAEHVYQACKAIGDDAMVHKILNAPRPHDAKRLGRTIQLKEGWDDVKASMMKGIVYRKFYQNQGLKQQLLETGDEELVEGNYWHDNFWGSCTCAKCGNHGENNLGKILMKVREHLRSKQDD